MNDSDARFGGMARLYGREGLARLTRAHVAVIGIGGVGSWVAEALARSGIGALTLVDLDEVCVSNVNRQLHALTDTVGRSKVEVMAERVRAIYPQCQVTTCAEFFTETTADKLLAPKFDFVIDAIDSVANKCRLIAACRARKLPVMVCGAAGGRRDATAVRVADLSAVTHDRLLAEVRKRLRKEHQFPREDNMGVPCVFSPEPPVFPQADGSVGPVKAPGDASEAGDENAGAVEEPMRLNCNWGLGSATFVTGTFGFAAAGFVVGQIAGNTEG